MYHIGATEFDINFDSCNSNVTICRQQAFIKENVKLFSYITSCCKYEVDITPIKELWAELL